MKTLVIVLLFAGLTGAQSLQKDFTAKFNISNSAFENGSEAGNPMPEVTFRKKKTGIAILYSLLLPGMGELYADSYESGKYFTIADAALWGTLAGFEIYGKWQENNYKAYAKAYGGVNPEGKDDKYFADIGNYIDIYQYNRDKELNRDFNAVYDEQNFFWQWRSQAQRREYRGIWKASENAYNSIRFVAGALILNRVASAINAVRLVVKHNKKVKEKHAWNFGFGVENVGFAEPELKFYFGRSF